MFSDGVIMKKKNGFSIVELILGMAAGAAIALVAYFLVLPAESWVLTQARRGGVSDCSAALTRMLSEIRLINGPSGIQTFAVSQLVFNDVDGSSISFQKSGTDLLMAGDVLTRHVQSLEFTYLDENGAVTAVRDDIRVIRVKLVILSGGQPVRLESAARLRNT
jgi:hypothetical protein